MLIFKRFSYFLAVMILVACNPKMASISTTASPIPSTASNQNQGTGDLGGGNGLNGKLFQDYIVNVTELPEYQKFIKPISLQLLKAQRESEKGQGNTMDCGDNSFLEVIAHGKTWYIAPVNLQTIAKKNLGVDFFIDPVQQLAIQNENEIWISSDVWAGMNEEERAKLLLHEMTESWYLLRFLPLPDFFSIALKVCHMTPPKDSDSTPLSTLPELRKYLEEHPQKDTDPEAKRALQGNDYAMIRGASDYLLRQWSDLKTISDLNNFYSIFNFDHRLINKGSNNTGKKINWSFPGISSLFGEGWSSDGLCQRPGTDTKPVRCMLIQNQDHIFSFASHVDGDMLSSIRFTKYEHEGPTTGDGLQPCPSGFGDCFSITRTEDLSQDQLNNAKVGDEFNAAVIWISLYQTVSADKTTSQSFSVDSLAIYRQKVVSLSDSIAKDAQGKETDYINRYVQLISLNDSYKFAYSRVALNPADLLAGIQERAQSNSLATSFKRPKP